jgi:Na+/H+ antiporter NhaD/arsenite permease-like protein
MDLLAVGVLAAVFPVVILRQLTGRGPRVWLTFVVGAVATLALGVLPLSGSVAVFSEAAPVLLFLLALFVFASALERSGALDHVALWLLTRARRAEDLPALVFVGFGVASALVLNDALVIVGAPTLLVVARRLRVSPVPLLLSMAFAVSVGSAVTPFGNPQNLLVALTSGLADPVLVFLRYLLLPMAIGLAFGGWYLRRAFGAQLRSEVPPIEAVAGPRVPFLPLGGWPARVRRYPVLVLFPATLAAIAGVSVAAPLYPALSLPTWSVALGGAVGVVALSPGRTSIVRRIDLRVLLLFVGLFVVVGGAVASGVVAELVSVLAVPGPGHGAQALAVIVGSSLAGPQLISNVPWVALQIPVLHSLGYGGSTPVPWMALAGASTLAGNVTLLGAASNLIVVEVAERQGVRIGLVEFIRYAAPLAAVTILVLWGCLAVGL